MSLHGGLVLRHKAAAEVTGTILVRAAALVRIILIGRLFTPEDYGAFSTALVVLILPQMILHAGYRSYLVRLDEGRFEESFGSVASAAGITSVLLYLLLAVSAGPLEGVLDQAGLGAVLLLVGVGVLDGVWQLPQAVLERRLMFGRARALEALSLLVGLSVLLILAWREFPPVWCMAWSFTASVLAKGPLLMFGAQRIPSLRPRRSELTPMAGFVLPLMGAAVLSFVSGRGDDLAVRWLYGTSAMGIYVIAFYLPALLQDLADSVNRVSLPVFSQISDPGELRATFRESVRISATLTAPIGFGGALFAEQIIRLAFGDSWLGAAPLLRIFFIAFGLRAATGMNWTALALLRGKTRYIAWVGVASALFLVVAGWPLIVWLGPLGGAVYTLVQLAVMGPFVRFPIIREVLGDLRSLGASIAPVTLSTVGVLSLWGLGAEDLQPFAAVCVLSAYIATTIGLLLFLDPLRRFTGWARRQ
jgi:PST family polysaccharide transporter